MHRQAVKEALEARKPPPLPYADTVGGFFDSLPSVCCPLSAHIYAAKGGRFMAVRIFIDQGHNPQGVNAGAEGFGYREQDINYAIGILLRDILLEDGRFEVRTSRNTPEESLGTSNTTSLLARVTAANRWDADYFISIHCNAGVSAAANGTAAYVFRLGSTAADLGQAMLSAVVGQLGTKDNGVIANPSLYVLRRTRMPAVLMELAFITNDEDVQKLVNEQYAFAYALYTGICRFLGYTPNIAEGSRTPIGF